MSINMDYLAPQAISSECYEHGKLLRKARRDADKTLCDVADKRQIDLVDASSIECGKVENLHISPEEWAA